MAAWGILGCGKISSDFANALLASGSKVVACAARSASSASEFAARFAIPKACSYDELLDLSSVTVVYIGTLHTNHFDLVCRALRKGKHVLCEKPLGMNSQEVCRLADLAKAEGLFLAEGMWTRCFPATKKVREILASGELGPVVHCTADLGFAIPESVERLYDLSLGGGGLLDLGIYPIAWVLLAFGGKGDPGDLQAVATLHEGGADMTGSVTMKFGEEGVGTAAWSCRSETQKETHICCTRGSIHVTGPWSAHAPEQVIVKKISENGETTEEVLEFPLEKFEGKGCPFNFCNSQGFVYEVQAVEKSLSEGKLEADWWTLEETRRCHEIMTKIRGIIGLKYPQD